MPIFWNFKRQNWRLTFMKWTPGSQFLSSSLSPSLFLFAFLSNLNFHSFLKVKLQKVFFDRHPKLQALKVTITIMPNLTIYHQFGHFFFNSWGIFQPIFLTKFVSNTMS